MRSFAAAAIVASAVLVGSLGSASAFPIKEIDPISGSFSGTSPTGTTSILPTPTDADLFPVFADSNTDFFGFYIPFLGSYNIVASVEATYGDNVNISSFLLYDSVGLLPGSPVADAMYTTILKGKYIALNRITLEKGLYYLGVEASGINPTPPSGYAGTISKALNPVPLPASAPLFGAALITLGGLGYGLKRRKAVAAA